MPHARIAPFLFAALVCLSACQSPGGRSDDDGGTDSPHDGGQIDSPKDAGAGDAGTRDGGLPTPHTQKEWMTQYVHASCAPMTRCPNFRGDPALCEALSCNKNPNKLPFGPQGALEVADQGEVAVDPVKLAACITAYENRPCEWFNVDSFEAYPECEGALTPRVSLGGVCHADESCEAGAECKSGTCQAFAAGRCTRTIDCPQGQSCTEGGSCIATTAPGGEGEHCTVNGTCAGGFACVLPAYRPANEGYCRRMVGAGETCSETAPCASDFICRGTCQPPYEEGDACDTDMCGWDLSDLVCGRASKQCVRLPTTGPCVEGSHCDFVSAYCDETQATPTCMPLKKEGDECGSTSECAGDVPSPITCTADAQGVKRCTRTGTSRCN